MLLLLNDLGNKVKLIQLFLSKPNNYPLFVVWFQSQFFIIVMIEVREGWKKWGPVHNIVPRNSSNFCFKLGVKLLKKIGFCTELFLPFSTRNVSLNDSKDVD